MKAQEFIDKYRLEAEITPVDVREDGLVYPGFPFNFRVRIICDGRLEAFNMSSWFEDVPTLRDFLILLGPALRYVEDAEQGLLHEDEFSTHRLEVYKNTRLGLVFLLGRRAIEEIKNLTL